MTSSGAPSLTREEQSRLRAAEQFRSKGASSVAELLAMLADPSWVVRRAVVEALASLGNAAVGPLCEVVRGQRDNEARIAAAVDALSGAQADAEEPIVALAADSNPAVVADAAQVLGRRRSERAIPLLVSLAKHDNDNVAVAAIEALGRIGGRAAVLALIDAVGSGSFFRTFPAIDVLGRSGDPRVVEPLTKLLANPNYLPEAARALGRSGERAAVRPLAELLASRSDAVVRVAVLALAELRERFEEKAGGHALVIDELIAESVRPEAVRRLTRVMSSADGAEATAVCKLLAATGDPQAAPLLRAKLDAPGPVAACAAEALKRLGAHAEAHLSQALREGTSNRRKVLLPTITRASAAADVAYCLDDPDPEVRALACDTLARLGNTGVVPRLFEVLHDANLRVVHSATSALQALGSREGRQLAADAALSDSPVVRRAALRILAYFGDRASLDPLLTALNDSDARVREAALQGLPYVEDKRAFEALFEAAKSADARTRAVAMRALGHVPNDPERACSLLMLGIGDADAWVRYYACQSLGRLAYAPAATQVAKLLEDPAGQVRVAAIEALSHLHSEDAHAALRQAAASDDADVKRAALVGLGIARRDEDLPLLLGAVNDSDTATRLIALSAIAGFRSSVVLGALSSAASDSDEQVRSAAIGFLASRAEPEATEVLIELLASDAAQERAKAALLIRSEGRISGLLSALGSANHELAPIIISILARIDRPEARAALSCALELNNVAARKAAASALAARRTPEALVALRQAAQNDPDQEVRHICALLLSE